MGKIENNFEESRIKRRIKWNEILKRKSKEITRNSLKRIQREQVNKKDEKNRLWIRKKLKDNEKEGILGDKTNEPIKSKVKINNLRDRIKAIPTTYNEVDLIKRQNDTIEMKKALDDYVNEQFLTNKDIINFKIENNNRNNPDIVTIKYKIKGDSKAHSIIVNKKDLVKYKIEKENEEEEK